MENGWIDALIDYAEKKGLADERDRVYYRNRLLELLGEDAYVPPTELPGTDSLQALLDGLCDRAEKNGVIGGGTTERDLFDTKVMALFTPLPSVVQDRFAADYRKSPQAATDGFYRLCRDCNYIRTERVAKDLRWTYGGKYGELDITINLSKPEKDPKAIAAALKAADGEKYPKCQLCG